MRPPRTTQIMIRSVWIMVAFLCFVPKNPTASSASGSCPPSTPLSASWGWQETYSSSSPSSISSGSRPWQMCICSTCPLQTCSLLYRSPFGQPTPWQSGCWAWRCARPCTLFTRSASTAACSFSLPSAWTATLLSQRPSPLTATAPKRYFSARCHLLSSGWWHWSSPYQKWSTPLSTTTPAPLTPAILTSSASPSRRARLFWPLPFRSWPWACVTAASSRPFVRLVTLNAIRPSRWFWLWSLSSWSAKCLITWSYFGPQFSQQKEELKTATMRTISCTPWMSPSVWPSWGAAWTPLSMPLSVSSFVMTSWSYWRTGVAWARRGSSGIPAAEGGVQGSPTRSPPTHSLLKTISVHTATQSTVDKSLKQKIYFTCTYQKLCENLLFFVSSFFSLFLSVQIKEDFGYFLYWLQCTVFQIQC